MTRIPGFAVSLFGLLGVAVAFGLIQLTRYWLRPLLQGFAAILRVIPLVGGFLSKQVLRFERIVDSWLASAALTTQRLMVGYFHGLTSLFARLGEEIAGLAADAYHALAGIVRVTIPRLLRAAESRLLRLIRAAERRLVDLGRLIGRQAVALAGRVANLERSVQAAILRAIRAAEGFTLREIRAAVGGILDAVHFLDRAYQAVEHRVGWLEREVVDAVWGELRRLAGDLRPDRLILALLDHVWSLVPRELRGFFEWVWHWLRETGEFFVALAEGAWPPPMPSTKGRSLMEDVQRDAKRFAAGLRDELRGR